MKNPIPARFQQMLRDLMGREADLLLEALDKEPVTSVRINRRKPLMEFSDISPVAWCKSGFYLKDRPEFIFDPLLHAGTYYVQDASSMIYETVVEKLVKSFPENKRLKVLDLCAAPGGKTTAMINALPDGTQVTANEYSPKRVGALRENIERWGYPDAIVTNKDSRFYATQGPYFDIVAVDAPCSGEGMMRKEEVARCQWTPTLVEQCSLLQREILTNAVQALRPGGFLIYSTCTFNRCENEDNADWLTNHHRLRPVDMDFPIEWGLPGGIGTDLPVYRFMPHKTRGEGLFLAAFQKPGEEVDYDDIDHGKKSPKTLSPSQKPFLVNVDRATAIRYLQGEAIVLPDDVPKGLVTVAYRDLPLGEAKNIGKRANNLYPKNRRILKR